uniref:Secreted protein n=1 Tax=Heterorhabditis bacteriophora TaxID=37862 RepID=A0A1I7WB61_HETBA
MISRTHLQIFCPLLTFLSFKNLGVDTSNFANVCTNKKVVEAVYKELQTYVTEIPKKIFLCSEPWTPASGLLTEALKLKRKNIEKEFKKELIEIGQHIVVSHEFVDMSAIHGRYYKVHRRNKQPR